MLHSDVVFSLNLIGRRKGTKGQTSWQSAIIYFVLPESKASAVLRLCVCVCVAGYSVTILSPSLCMCNGGSATIQWTNQPTSHSIMLPLKHLVLCARRLQEETSSECQLVTLCVRSFLHKKNKYLKVR